MTTTQTPPHAPAAATTARYATHDTPLGEFVVVATADGTVIASRWTDDADADARRAAARNDITQLTHADDLGTISEIVDAYFAGDVHAIDEVPVAQSGDGFRMKAWDALRRVPAGAPVSYGELAELSGSPGAARAAGTACATNSVPLFVPCHRVVKSGGAIGNFGFGVDAKRWLLEHEAENA